MQFLFPGFLVGMLGVSVPVIIHLLQLRRPQRILFTNTGFLREAELKDTRRRKVQRWVLLVLRTLAVAALVLAFSQPFIPARKLENASGADPDVLVVVDTTPSMLARVERGRAVDEAVGAARALGKLMRSGTRFRLLNDQSGPLAGAAFDRALPDLRASGRGIGLGQKLVSEMARHELEPVYIFSDFQKTGIDAAFFKGLGRREVVLTPVRTRAEGNLYVDSVWVDDAFIRAGTNFTLRVRLRNGGLEGLADCPVKVLLDDRQVAAFRATVDAGKTAVSTVQAQVTGDKLTTGRVVTGDVGAAFDNEFYFTLQPATTVRVVEIGDGEPITERAYANEPLFAYSFSKPNDVDYGQVRRANLVLLREAKRVNEGLREALAAVVRRGGSVVVVPAVETASRPSYQQLFQALGLGSAQWETPATGNPELREVAMPSRQDPFFRDVFGAQPRQVAMPKVAPVLRWTRTGADILRLRDGDGYLSGFGDGVGRVYVFSAPFDPKYSDFASHALFVPVLYRLAMLSYRNDQLPAYRLTQPSVVLTVPKSAGGQKEARFRLIKDSATFIPAQRLRGQELRLNLPENLSEPGFYKLQRADGQVVTTLAFNTDRAESELAAYSPAELRELTKDAPNVRVLEPGTTPEAALVRDRADRTGRPLWRYCLLAALACLLAEGALLRFGNRPMSRVVAGA